VAFGFEFLFEPLVHADGWLGGPFDGAALPVALAIAVVLGLRHASDPDHLVAVTSLVAAEDRGTRDAVKLGGWWGLGHAATLLATGLPLILLAAELPGWLERGAEAAVGVVIALLAARVCWKWARGGYRASSHRHPDGAHRHLHRGTTGHEHDRPRGPRQAFGIGLLHGLAGTGAVVLLLIAALPSRGEAALALAAFAPMSVVSMAALTGAWAWALTRPVVAPAYRTVLIPALGVFGMTFGAWYALGAI